VVEPRGFEPRTPCLQSRGVGVTGYALSVIVNHGNQPATSLPPGAEASKPLDDCWGCSMTMLNQFGYAFGYGLYALCFPAGVGSWLLGAVGLGRYRWGKACEYSFGVVVCA